MNKSTKAVLLSLLVLPGAGHIFLKNYFLGFLLASISFLGAYYLLSVALDMAYEISEKVKLGKIQPDIVAISELLSKQLNTVDTQLFNMVMTTIVICWLVGIIDSYRIGRLQEKSNN